MEFTKIIIKPLHSEKTYAFASFNQKKYAFLVDPKATKYDILVAFESIYGIRPSKIATQLRKPAKVRTGTLKPGFSKLIKIAYVTLPAGSDIATKEDPKEKEAKIVEEKPKQAEKKDTVKKEITKKEVTKKGDK